MFKELREKIEAVDKKVIAGFSLLAIVSVSGYFYYKSRNNTPTPKPQSHKNVLRNANQRKENDSQSPEKTLIRITNTIKKVLPPGERISYEAVMAIYEGQFQLSRKEFHQLIMHNRTERRKVINNLKKYFEFIRDFEERLEQIHNNNLNAIIAQFGIKKPEWIELIDQISEQMKDEWENILLSTERQQLDSIRNKNKPKLRIPMLLEIFKLKIKKLQQSAQALKGAVPDIEPSDFYALIQKWIEDMIYDKYKVEHEDINYSINQLTPQQRQEIENYEQEEQELMKNLILDDEDGDEDEDGHIQQANQV